MLSVNVYILALPFADRKLVGVEIDGADPNYVYWVQSFYAFLSIIVTGIVGYIANNINTRQKMQGAITERRLFETFTGDRIFCVKKALNHSSFREYIDHELPAKIAEWELQSKMKPLDWQKLLEEVKSNINHKISGVEYEFFEEKITTDSIEYMLNEYISISKLICSDVIDFSSITSLGADNFVKVYDKLRPFIHLRRKLSKDYAIEYEVVVVALKGGH